MSTQGLCMLGTCGVAIKAHPKPSTKSQLISFLNFYRRNLRGAASILKPLTDATRGVGGKHSQLEKTKEMGKAFVAAKAALTEATHLAHPIKEELSLAASNHHIGAALQQRTPGGEWQPLSFYSRKLTDTETRYSTFNRELLAVVAALRHFWFLLEGRNFHVLTDHKPLVFALLWARDAWSGRQGRGRVYLRPAPHGRSTQRGGRLPLKAPGGALPTQVAGVKVPSGSLAAPVTGWELWGLFSGYSGGSCYSAGAHQVVGPGT